MLNGSHITGFDHVFVVVGSMLCHFAVLYLVRYRKAMAAVVWRAPPPPASPVWWAVFGAVFVAVTWGRVAAARAGVIDVSWVFLVAALVSLVTNADHVVLSRRIVRHARSGDG